MTKLPQRKSPRLKGYDYAQNGCCFVTICTKNRAYLFGDIVDGKMELNEYGRVANEEMLNVSTHYQNVNVDKYVIMPNHVHLLVRITCSERINPLPTGDIPNIIGKYKAGVTRTVGNAFMHSEPLIIWQKSYHDHIIRDERSYLKIYEYIENNPLRWDLDCHNPQNSKYKDWSMYYG